VSFINNNACEVCGVIRKRNQNYIINSVRMCLCQKHYGQYKKYGKFLDNNPLTKYDKNIINIYEDYAEIEIRDKNLDIKCKSKIDIEDIQKIKDFKCCLNAFGYVVSQTSGVCTFLHRFILDAPDGFEVDHINGDRLDNRKNNLRICKKQDNVRNTRNGIKRSSSGIIGVRKDTRCKNSWRAQIYIDKNKKIEKTFKDKELAILQRLIWELIYFKEYAPQIELIKSEYKYLLGIQQLTGMTFSDDIELIKDIGTSLKNDPHCPCMLVKNESTICPCLPCRTKQHCCCGLYVKKQ